MFQDSPAFSILTFLISVYLFYVWLVDFIYFQRNKTSRKNALEGATSISIISVFLGVLSALILLAVNVFTEISLGVEQKQTAFSAWAILSWIGAAAIEEIIFRGYLVVKNRGTFALVASILFFSVIFALGHPFIWDFTVPHGASIHDGVWSWNFSAQPILATVSIFECSILFYFLRFMPLNTHRSLLPCMAAHLTYNIGVFAVKFFQGFIS